MQCEGRAQWITGQGTAVQCALHLSLCLDQSAPMIKEYGPNHWHGSAPARDKAVLHVMREEQDKKKKKKKAHVESAKEEGQKKGEEGRKEKEKKREKEKEKAERPLKSAVKRAKKEQVDDEMCRGSNNPVPCPGLGQGLTYTAPRRAAWHCTAPDLNAVHCCVLPCPALRGSVPGHVQALTCSLADFCAPCIPPSFPRTLARCLPPSVPPSLPPSVFCATPRNAAPADTPL